MKKLVEIARPPYYVVPPGTTEEEMVEACVRLAEIFLTKRKGGQQAPRIIIAQDPGAHIIPIMGIYDGDDMEALKKAQQTRVPKIALQAMEEAMGILAARTPEPEIFALVERRLRVDTDGSTRYQLLISGAGAVGRTEDEVKELIPALTNDLLKTAIHAAQERLAQAGGPESDRAEPIIKTLDKLHAKDQEIMQALWEQGTPYHVVNRQPRRLDTLFCVTVASTYEVDAEGKVTQVLQAPAKFNPQAAAPAVKPMTKDLLRQALADLDLDI